MSHKNKKEKENRNSTWIGYFPRRTKTKKEKIESIEKKHKNSQFE